MGKADKEANVAAGMGIGAAITGFLVWLRSRIAPAIPGQLVIPDELAELLAATAAAIDRIDKNIASLQVSVQGWPPSTKRIRSFTLTCLVANVAYQGPSMLIPDGMHLLLKASPWNGAAAVIQVATSPAECLNVNSSHPLILNEPVSFAIEDAQNIFISTNLAGSQVIFSAEERSA